MNFFKRGITSIVRKPGKTIILLALVFILGNVIAGAISITQAVDNTEENLRQKLSPVVSLDYLDWQELEEKYGDEYWEKIKPITPEQIKAVGELPQVKDYDYISYASLTSETYKRYYGEEDMYYGGSSREWFQLQGIRRTEPLGMGQNKMKLVSGRTFSDAELNELSYVILISNKFAELNGISLGDKIPMESVLEKAEYNAEGDYWDYGDSNELFSSKTYELEVVGIYETIDIPSGESSTSGQMDWEKIERENGIYIPEKAAEEISQYEYNEQKKMMGDKMEWEYEEYYTPLIVLNDPTELDDFKEQAGAILPEHYRVVDDSNAYDKIAAPMKSVQWIAQIVLYIAIGATLVILSLLITLFLRDRKHEIGIYLALGEKKIKVVTQIVLEVAVISIIAITLSLFSGNVLSRFVSDKMLNDQIIAQQEEQKNNDEIYGMTYNQLDSLGYGSNLTTEDLKDTYAVSLDLSTILLFYAVGLGTIVISTLVPIVYITRLNPKKIMM